MSDARATLYSLNAHLSRALDGVLVGLGDDEIRYSAPAIDERPIAAIALHAYGGVVAFMSSVAGDAWPTPVPAPESVDELRGELTRRREAVDALIGRISDEAMSSEITLPWGERMAALDALTASFAHALIHVGNIGGVRAIGGFPTPVETY